jgi:hypothetical protein
VHPGSDWQSFCAAAAARFTTPFPEMRLASLSPRRRGQGLPVPRRGDSPS